MGWLSSSLSSMSSMAKQSSGDKVEKKREPEQAASRTKSLPKWVWPVGLVTTGLAGAAVVLLRGCWHRKMSWPIRVEGYSYQVCLGCGAKRLFDETKFHGFGPYSYDLRELIARVRAARMKSQKEDDHPVISAS